jgi:hypothetical protein
MTAMRIFEFIFNRLNVGGNCAIVRYIQLVRKCPQSVHTSVPFSLTLSLDFKYLKMFKNNTENDSILNFPYRVLQNSMFPYLSNISKIGYNFLLFFV